MLTYTVLSCVLPSIFSPLKPPLSPVSGCFWAQNRRLLIFKPVYFP